MTGSIVGGVDGLGDVEPTLLSSVIPDGLLEYSGCDPSIVGEFHVSGVGVGVPVVSFEMGVM